MRAVSYSGIEMYSKCPKSFQYRYLLETPDGDPPTEESAPALFRGRRLHQSAEDYVRGEISELPKELGGHQRFFDRIMRVGTAVPEEEWNFDTGWQRLEFDQTEEGQVRGIIDLCLPQGPLLEIFEYKTGKVYPSHADQRSLYSLAGLLMYPEAQVVRTTTVYFDLGGADKTLEVERGRLSTLQWNWQRRINKCAPPQQYVMRPGRHCKFCNYSKSRGGPCPNG